MAGEKERQRRRRHSVRLAKADAAFVKLSKTHRKGEVYYALADAHGVPEAAAREHFALAASLVDEGGKA